MSGYDVVISSSSSSRPRRVVYREPQPYNNSWQVDVYSRRSSERVYVNNRVDYEYYHSYQRKRTYRYY
jgi:hypothetical protein